MKTLHKRKTQQKTTKSILVFVLLCVLASCKFNKSSCDNVLVGVWQIDTVIGGDDILKCWGGDIIAFEENGKVDLPYNICSAVSIYDTASTKGQWEYMQGSSGRRISIVSGNPYFEDQFEINVCGYDTSRKLQLENNRFIIVLIKADRNEQELFTEFYAWLYRTQVKLLPKANVDSIVLKFVKELGNDTNIAIKYDYSKLPFIEVNTDSIPCRFARVYSKLIYSSYRTAPIYYHSGEIKVPLVFEFYSYNSNDKALVKELSEPGVLIENLFDEGCNKTRCVMLKEGLMLVVRHPYCMGTKQELFDVGRLFSRLGIVDYFYD